MSYSNLEELDDIIRRLSDGKKAEKNDSAAPVSESVVTVSSEKDEDVISFSEEWKDMNVDDDVISLDKLGGNAG